MKQTEIEQAAKEVFPVNLLFKTDIDTSVLFRQIWIDGANFVNSRQREDMRVFYVWCIRNGWHPYDDDGDFTEWLNVKTNKLELFDRVLKLWEESK
jgi:hypothetical protein